MSYKRISPIPVAEGGMGNSSIAAYSVLCGGTTTTGSLQTVSGLGSSTQVLTSNGASALPTWQNAGGGGGGATTPWTPALLYAGSASGATFNKLTGSYLQIGNLVYYSFFMYLSSANGPGGGELITIGGLPVTASTQQSYEGLCSIGSADPQLPIVYVWNNGSSTLVYLLTSSIVNGTGAPDTADGGFTTTDITDTSIFQVTGSYLSA